MKKLHVFITIFFIFSTFGIFCAACQQKQTNIKRLNITNPKKNNYPIILVHGFMGWGRNELLGYKYWGGITDIEENLNKDGYKTYTAVIGPLSSNWDRACELYAFIKGGTVDYGKAHSKKFGHLRYGRTFKGLYPDWGKLNSETGKINKVHLISHSMGGQTGRMLAQLLEKGFKEEQKVSKVNNLSDLFKGNKTWIDSITTISTPHNGSTVALMTEKYIPFARNFIASISSFSTEIGADGFFDFKLDQWGIKLSQDDYLLPFYDRIINSNIWDKKNKDLSLFDTSPSGAKQLNKWVTTLPDIYYFSWATKDTNKSYFSNHQAPNISMFPFLIPYSYFMGEYTQNDPDKIIPNKIVIDKSWWKNDGMVNTKSMHGPTLGQNAKLIDYNGNPKRGVWNVMGTQDSCDHFDIIGQMSYPCEDCPIGYDSIYDWYQQLAKLVLALP